MDIVKAKDEMLDWLTSGNLIRCKDLEDREMVFRFCESMGYVRGFSNNKYKDYMYMYLAKYLDPAEVHARGSASPGDNVMTFAEWFGKLDAVEEKWESCDPALLYVG